MVKMPTPAADVVSGLHKKHGKRLFGQAIDQLMPAKPSLKHKLAKAVLLRIATRSLPGAVLVGGGLLMKHLHGKHLASKAAAGDIVVDVTPREAGKRAPTKMSPKLLPSRG